MVEGMVFGEVGGGSGFSQGGEVDVGVGQQEDGAVGWELGVASEQGGGLVAVEDGEVCFQKDKVGRVVDGAGKNLVSVGNEQDLVALSLEFGYEGFERGGVRACYEDVCHDAPFANRVYGVH